MALHGRPTARRRIGIGVALAVALILVLAPVFGRPPVTAVTAPVVIARDAGPRIAPATSVVCPDDTDRDDEPAEIGTAVDVDGIEIQLEGADVALGTNTLTAVVGGKNGGPLTGALVYLTIRMPTMDHGTSAYPATEVEPGRYRAEDVSLGMGGDWLVTVEVIRQARTPISASYVVTVAE